MPNKTFKGTFTTAVDLQQFTGAEGQLPAEIPVLPKGEFMTMPYGNIVLNDSVFEQMIGNFKAGIRRAVAVDVDHAMNGESKAAGWVKELINKADGLWAKVDWNKLGKELVGEKIYRMISAEWSFDYIDPQKSTHHGAVLAYATLTNRPLMQSMPTITASENHLTNPNRIMILFNESNKTMPTLEDVLKKPVAERTADDLKVLEDSKADLTDAQKSQLETEKADADKAEAEAKAKADADAAKEKEEAEAEAGEAAEKGDVEATEKALVKAGRTAEEAKTAAEKMVADAKENTTIKASELKRLQKIEADSKVAAEMKAATDFSTPFYATEDGGKIAPVGKEALVKLAQSLNAEQKELLTTVLNATADQKITGEKGKAHTEGLTATEEYNKLVAEYMKAGKTASEANRLVKKEDKEVYEAFTKENE